LSLDEHFTPTSLARLAAESLGLTTSDRPVVADFAAGHGALLRAAREVHSDIRLAAADLSAGNVRVLQSEGDWEVSRCDFLRPASRARSRVAATGRRYDGVIINPPFSYRGQGGVLLGDLPGQPRVSPAAAFVLFATDYVAADGALVAILPAGTMKSERDAWVWGLLRRSWGVESVDEFRRGAFPGLAARTILLRLTRKTIESFRIPDPLPSQIVARVRLVRGCTPMHRVDDRGKAVVHTTGLQGGRAAVTGRSASSGRVFTGPGVLLPRVGAPRPDKIALFPDVESVVLSDCVIGLECGSLRSAIHVQKAIVGNWTGVADAWGGSCAPYTTVARLTEKLLTIGVDVVPDSATAQITNLIRTRGPGDRPRSRVA
jgi:hypothetical protein